METSETRYPQNPADNGKKFFQEVDELLGMKNYSTEFDIYPNVTAAFDNILQKRVAAIREICEKVKKGEDLTEVQIRLLLAL